MTRDDMIKLLAREIVDELNREDNFAITVLGYGGLNCRAEVNTRGEELIEKTIDRVLKDEQRRAA